MTHPDWAFARDRLGLVDRPEQSQLFTDMLTDPTYVVGGEGSTGIGKSALAAALAMSGRRIVYTARSKAQQQQMAEFCGEQLEPTGLIDGWELLYGRSNYICLRRAELARRHLSIVGDGSRSHYPELEDWEWSKVNSNLDEDCGFGNCEDQDARNLALKRAWTTRFLITNHNIVCLQMIVPHLLGRTDDRVLLVDEGHDLPGVISDTFGAEVSVRRLTQVNNLVNQQTMRTSPLAHAADLWRATLQKYGDRPDELWHDREMAEQLVADAVIAAQMTQAKLGSPVDRLVRDLGMLASADEAGEYARYVENAKSKNPKAVVKALVTSTMARRIFSTYTQAYVMSATLRGLPEVQLGLGDVHVGRSPFNLAGRRFGYTTPKLDKDGNAWDPGELDQLIKAVGGGHTLVLATSHTQKTLAAELMEARGYRVGVQGDAGSTGVNALVDELKAGEIDVLVGTEALMTGIDIPGEALRMVVLLKWPTPAYKRPFEASMGRRLQAYGLSPWADYFDPQGELKARQSIGRLIRTVDDWGVLACLDPRYRNKRKFWKLISPSNYSQNLADVENFASLFR